MYKLLLATLMLTIFTIGPLCFASSNELSSVDLEKEILELNKMTPMQMDKATTLKSFSLGENMTLNMNYEIITQIIFERIADEYSITTEVAKNRISNKYGSIHNFYLHIINKLNDSEKTKVCTNPGRRASLTRVMSKGIKTINHNYYNESGSLIDSKSYDSHLCDSKPTSDSLYDKLLNYSNQLNATLPQRIDSSLTLMHASAKPRNTLEYELKINKSNLLNSLAEEQGVTRDTLTVSIANEHGSLDKYFKKVIKLMGDEVTQNACNDLIFTKLEKSQSVNLNYLYYDEDSRFIDKFVLKDLSCKQLK